jgi:hypothetical protein
MAPKASVQEASPSPPPLPPGPLPTTSSSSAGPSESRPTDVPIASLGEDDDEEEEGEGEDQDEGEAGGSKVAGSDDDEEWDPADERLPGQGSKDKGKGKATEQDANQPWQAVWAAEQNGMPKTHKMRKSRTDDQRGTFGTPRRVK